MTEVLLFVEDRAHQVFLKALIKRMLHDMERVDEPDIRDRSVRRGHPAVIRELKIFLRDLLNSRVALPGLVVVATDANCQGLADRSREISAITGRLSLNIVHAIPDPHIERWLMLDSAAFKQVLGRGCQAPDQKCERGRYKKLLRDAVSAAGIEADFGGIEYTEDIVVAMDLDRVAQQDISFARLMRDLRTALQQL